MHDLQCSMLSFEIHISLSQGNGARLQLEMDQDLTLQGLQTWRAVPTVIWPAAQLEAAAVLWVHLASEPQ